jgi:hypothetical protein
MKKRTEVCGMTEKCSFVSKKCMKAEPPSVEKPGKKPSTKQNDIYITGKYCFLKNRAARVVKSHLLSTKWVERTPLSQVILSRCSSFAGTEGSMTRHSGEYFSVTTIKFKPAVE